MMNAQRRSTLLNAACRGRLDEMSAADVSALSDLLNADDGTARLLAQASTTQRGWNAPSPAMPSGAEWSRVWSGVCDRLDSGAASQTRHAASTSRVWKFRPFAAAAVCVLMVSVLTRFRPALADEPMQLDTKSEISAIEVSGNSSAFVVDSEEDGPIVWVVENDE